MSDFADVLEPVALRLLQAPNPRLSNKRELRFGAHGSMSVVIAGDKKGTWHDHEAGRGGGTLDLIERELHCDRRGALGWLQTHFPDVFAPPSSPSTSSKIVAEYSYEDEEGREFFQVVRMEPKTFRQRRPDGKGGWIWDMKGVRPVPYRLPELMEATAQDKLVFIVEGEKDVDALRRLNVSATTNAGGAGRWPGEFSTYFAGAHAVIIPDNDVPGRNHAKMVAESLAPVAASIKVLALPDLPHKGDVSDWIAAGGQAEGLYALAEATPTWRPAAPSRLPRVWFGREDEHPALSWLVKGVLTNGGLSALIGPPGCSKSFVALDLSLHIAHGFDWFGRSVEHGAVVYLSGEGGAGMLARMKAWRQAHPCSPGPFALIPAAVNLFDGDEGTTTLLDELKDIRKAAGADLRLVVIDTLSRMIGSGDEDRARDINIVMQNAAKIQASTGAHVMVVHHTGKDEGRGARGSNNIQGGADTVIQIKSQGNDRYGAEFTKIKDGGAALPLTYTLAQSVLGVDADGDDITSCVIAPSDASPGDSGKKTPHLSNRDKIALEALAYALDEHGEPAPTSNHIPQTVTRVVRIEHWRTTAYARGIASSDKAFQRAQESLQADRRIGIWEPFAWIA